MNDDDKRLKTLEKRNYWLSILLAISVVACITLAFVAIGQHGLVTETKQQYDDNYQSGYTAGYSDGKDEGYDQASETYDSQSVETDDEDYYSTQDEEDSSESSSEASDSDTSDDSGGTVYVTDTGSCYHHWGCGYLKDSANEISLEDAESQGYRPCSRCCN